MDSGKKWLFLDIIVCAVLIFFSLFIFSRMPDDMGIGGWIMFFIAGVFFAIGLFRLLNYIDDPKNIFEMRLKAAIFAITSVIIQVMGYTILYHEKGNIKGIAIATFTLIVGVAMEIMISDEAGVIPDKIRNSLGWFITAFLIGFAIWINIRDGFSDGSIAVGTLLIIEVIAGGPFLLSGN